MRQSTPLLLSRSWSISLKRCFYNKRIQFFVLFSSKSFFLVPVSSATNPPRPGSYSLEKFSHFLKGNLSTTETPIDRNSEREGSFYYPVRFLMKLSKYRLIIAASAAASDGLMFDSYRTSLQLDDLVVRAVTCKVSWVQSRL